MRVRRTLSTICLLLAAGGAGCGGRPRADVVGRRTAPRAPVRPIPRYVMTVRPSRPPPGGRIAVTYSHGPDGRPPIRGIAVQLSRGTRDLATLTIGLDGAPAHVDPADNPEPKMGRMDEGPEVFVLPGGLSPGPYRICSYVDAVSAPVATNHRICATVHVTGG